MVQIWKHEGWYTAGATDAYIENLADFDDAPCDQFRPVGDRFPKNTTIRIESQAAPTDYFASGPYFLASERLKDVLVEFKVPAEFFEVNVVQNGQPYCRRKYYLVNLLDQVDCLDRQLSKYDHPGPHGYISNIRQIVIDEAKAAGHHLFGLKYYLVTTLCVSEELAKRVRVEGITGIQIVPPSERFPFEWADE